MSDAMNEGKKFQRSRRRVYESADPAEIVASAVVAEDAPESEAAEPRETALCTGSDEDSPCMAITAADGAGSSEDSALPVVATASDRDAKALGIVKHYSAWAAGAGVVPVPILDLFSMLAVQTRMIRKLADLYEIPYSEQRIKSALAGLVGGYHAGLISSGAVKMFPFIGMVSLAVMPTFNAAIAYAVGKVFIQHFETGGTFLDFNPVKERRYFEEKFHEAGGNA